MKNILIALPTELAAGILTEWILPASLTMLDEAFCHKKHRYSLFTLYRSTEFVIIHEVFPKRWLLFGTWVMRRKVALRNLVIGAEHLFARNDRMLKLFRQIGADITRIELRKTYDTHSVRALAASLTKLRVLHAVSVSEFSMVDAILQHSQNTITELEFDSISLSRLKPLSLSLPQMRVLRIDFCFTDVDILISLVRDSPNLQELRICALDTTWGVENGTALVSALSKGAKCLQRLTLEFISAMYIDDRIMADLAVLFPGLTYLGVHDCQGVTAAGIAHFAQQCTLLQHVEVSSNCGSVVNGAARVLAQHCGLRLRHLSLTGCATLDPAVMLLLGTHCRELRTLSLHMFASLEQEALLRLIASLQQLHSLDLYGTPLNEEVRVAVEQRGLWKRSKPCISGQHSTAV